MGILDGIRERILQKSNEKKEMTYEDFVKMLPYQADIMPYQSVYNPPTLSIAPLKVKSFAYGSDVYRTILNSLRQEVFRKGFKIDQCYDSKCTRCGSTYDYVADECENCGSKCTTPPIIIRERLEERIATANPSQNLLQLMDMLEEDLNIFDNLYLVLEKEYDIRAGEIYSAEVSSLHRGDPVFMRKLINQKGQLGYMGNKRVLVCPRHRGLTRETPGNCPECGTKLYPAHFAQVALMGAMEAKPIAYFIKGEVIHRTKFTPTMGYGVPPILTLFRKINTLIQEDAYLMRTFADQKPPKGVVLIKTSNANSLFENWRRMIDEATRKPHLIFPLAVPSEEGNRGRFVEFIEFMRTFQELQFVEHRDEFRKAIGAFFGVLPLFMGDTSASGGMNNERLQVVVTNRAIERAQSIHNSVLKDLVEEMGIDSWTITLEPSEDRDELNDLQIEQQKLQNALLYKQLGYRPILGPDREWTYEWDESLGLQDQLQGVGWNEQNQLGADLKEISPLPMRPSSKPQSMEGEPYSTKSKSRKKNSK